jgi:flagellar basal-body rod protein FlgC
MALFQALHTATSGAKTARIWLDAIADNVANVNTTNAPGEEPFRARMVVAEATTGADGRGTGTRVRSIELRGGDAPVAYDPTHPDADEFGLVTRANVDMATEMSNLLLANRVFQMNLTVMDRAIDSYRAALRIGT